MPNETPTFSIERELRGMGDDQRASCEYYLQELNACLQQTTPYALRDDSRLAFRYATGHLPMWTPHGVAHEMACTQFLCDTLSYQQTQQPFLRELAAQLKERSGCDWKAVWTAVSELGPEILKLHLMGEAALSFPEFAPTPASA